VDPPKNDDVTRTVIARPGAPGASAGDDRAHYLVVVEGDGPGRRFEIGGENLVVGRMEPAAIVVADPLASRNHCRVGLVMGELFVTDLDSSNGTFVSGKRVSRAIVSAGERITIGSTVLEHEWRSKREVMAAQATDMDLDKAKQYVRSLLPAPLESGPIRTDWVLQPSAKLGGDLFGYHFIDDRTFAIYLLDVTGHGTGAAMHAVSVMNVLRQRSVPGVDMKDPARAAAHLNEMFPMESHGRMLLSLWYGVFDLATRNLAFTSAGHHASYLVDAQRRETAALDVSNVLIGMIPGYAFKSGNAQVPAGSTLYVFSDGVFEIEPANGGQWGLDDFLALLAAPGEPGKREARRILETVVARTGRQAFEDDFTLVATVLL
jgi:serine phosphatase RsbU (regulator of sigma subunit)